MEASMAQDVTYNFVNNEYLVSESRTWMKVHDPVRLKSDSYWADRVLILFQTTQRFNTRVPESLTVEVQNAVQAAAEAQPAWAATSISKRRALMLDFHFSIKQNAPYIVSELRATYSFDSILTCAIIYRSNVSAFKSVKRLQMQKQSTREV